MAKVRKNKAWSSYCCPICSGGKSFKKLTKKILHRLQRRESKEVIQEQLDSQEKPNEGFINLVDGD